MACGGPFAGKAGETFGFRITGGEAVCAGQRVDTVMATRETAGSVTYTNEELRAGVEWELEDGFLYNLLLLCVPPGSTLTVRVAVGEQTFDDECIAAANGRVGPWLVFVAPAAVAEEGGEL